MRVMHWGMVDYAEALARQKELVRAVAGGASGVLVLCEHPVVITLGRKAAMSNILISGQDLERRGISLVAVDRGGDVTLHAPGQLVAYPVMDLKTMGRDIRMCLQKMEQASVDFLLDFDIVARGQEAPEQGGPSYRGVWVGSRKIASMGIGISRWVTYHGIGLNISTDMGLFDLIRPCGLDVQMTSVKRLTGRVLPMREAAERFAEHFIRICDDKDRSSGAG